VCIEPLEPGQPTAPVGLAAGALDDAVKTLVGVHAHWYAVLEIVVVTVTVEGPGAGAAEVARVELVATVEEEEAEEAAADEEAGAIDEAGAVDEAGTDDVDMVRTSRPPIMLLFVLEPVTALFK
jgi:hypothetical protein